MNKSVYLRTSISELSEVEIHEFWYDYVKPKYGENTKLYYVDTDSFMVYIKTEDIAKNFSEEFDSSNYQLDKPLP